MLKSIISASVITAALLFSGCGSADSNGEKALEAQHAIDTGNSDLAIALLEPTPIADLNETEQTAFLATLDSSTKMTLASAYMQEADVSIMDIVSKLDTADGQTSSFATIAEDIIGDSNSTETADKVKSIDSAIAYYESMITTSSSSLSPSFKASASDLNISEVTDGAKLYLGMAYFSKVTMLLSFFGDVAALESGSVSTYTDSYKATEKAIKCFYSSDCTDVTFLSTISPGSLLGDTQLTEDVEQFTVLQNGKTFYRVASAGTTTSNTGSLLVFNYRGIDDTLTYGTGSYSDLLVVSEHMPFGSTYKFEEQILNALNGAYDLVLDKAPDDVKADMQEKFAEVDLNSDQDISMDEIRAYMAK